jgi:hypothetical protein
MVGGLAVAVSLEKVTPSHQRRPVLIHNSRYSTVDLKDPELELRLAEWEFYYNWYRPTVPSVARHPTIDTWS